MPRMSPPWGSTDQYQPVSGSERAEITEHSAVPWQAPASPTATDTQKDEIGTG